MSTEYRQFVASATGTCKVARVYISIEHKILKEYRDRIPLGEVFHKAACIDEIAAHGSWLAVGKANTGNTTTEAARTEVVSEYFILTVDIDTHQNDLGSHISLYPEVDLGYSR